MIRYALFSVSDKKDVISLAECLHRSGLGILSTGGTAITLREAGLPVTDVSTYTGFPEMMNGRVKTLHPKIYGGILSRREDATHRRQMEAESIDLIDYVVVNLYPFEETVSRSDVSLSDAIEDIDIGGPSLIRSAAKNHHSVVVLTDPKDYEPVIKEIEEQGDVRPSTREKLAVRAFQRTARYDAEIHRFFSKRLLNEESISLHYTGGISLPYGENPHQEARIYFDESGVGIGRGERLHGKALSYNNYLDAQAGIETTSEITDSPAACVIKHGNPCGFATGKNIFQAVNYAWEGDVISAFGSVVVCNRMVDLPTAEFFKEKFVEVIAAPDFTQEALSFLKNKSKNLRLVRVKIPDESPRRRYRFIPGALLEQSPDERLAEDFRVVTQTPVKEEEKGLFEFTCQAVKHVKSNAVVLGHAYAPGHYMVLGIGAGQPNRVDAIRKLAVVKAEENIARLYPERDPARVFTEVVLSSDAFFPFADNIEFAHQWNIKKIVQPGGSKRDRDVIAACDQWKIAMAFTGVRHFTH